MGYSIFPRGGFPAWLLVLALGLCIIGCSKREKEEEKPPPQSLAELEERIRTVLY